MSVSKNYELSHTDSQKQLYNETSISDIKSQLNYLLSVANTTVVTETGIYKIQDTNYLTFTSEESFSITPSQYWGYNSSNPIRQYSIDKGKTWNDWTIGTTISSNENLCIKFRGANIQYASSTEDYVIDEKWTLTGNNIYCKGNIETILDYTLVRTNVHPTMAKYCYKYMFKGCTSLITAPELPASTLTYGCYQTMFAGCTSLTTPPDLPASKLKTLCYCSMFYGCTSLTTAPELPATTLAENCYQNMFNGCTNLTTAPKLSVTTLSRYCYNSMFKDCTSLTTPPELPATTLANGCYEYMFQGCTGLTTAPYLPYTSLKDVNNCYIYMFSGCKSLKVSNSSGTKFFTCPSDTTTTCVTNMFENTGGMYTSDPVADGMYFYY